MNLANMLLKTHHAIDSDTFLFTNQQNFIKTRKVIKKLRKLLNILTCHASKDLETRLKPSAALNFFKLIRIVNFGWCFG